MNRNFAMQNSHPLIQREQTYVLNRKLVSIHSVDRDYIKWPHSNHFGIDLGEGYQNVQSIRLVDYSFPCNNYTFSNEYQNTKLSFTYSLPYELALTNLINNQLRWVRLREILEALWGPSFSEKPSDVTVQLNTLDINGNLNWEVADINETNINSAVSGAWNSAALARLLWSPAEFTINIPEGNYDSDTLTSTIQTMMNEKIFYQSSQTGYNFLPMPTTVTPNTYILPNTNPSSAWNNVNGIKPMKVKYNKVTNKIIFGSEIGRFKLNFAKQETYNLKCNVNKPVFTQFTKWGLPSYLGFDRENYKAVKMELGILNPNSDYVLSESGLALVYEELSPWLVSNNKKLIFNGNDFTTVGNNVVQENLYCVYISEGILNLNINGEDAIYMELIKYNNMDEIYPYSIKTNHLINNDLGHRSNGAFAKIPIIKKAYNKSHGSENCFVTNFFHSSPPTPKIDKLEFRFRYHDGRLVDFKNLPFCFTLEFNMLRDEQQRAKNIRVLQLYNI